MKRFFACFVSLAAVLVAGCSHDRNEDDELIGDFLNYSVGFSVTNAQTGVDLLDPEFEGNILDQPITVHYGDAEYTLLKHSEEERPETRSNAPRPLGLRLARLLMGHEGTTPIPSPWLLQFGEFSPTSDYRGEAFTIDWGNGISNTICFDCYIVWHNSHEPEVVRNLWLDGVEQDSWLLQFHR